MSDKVHLTVRLPKRLAERIDYHANFVGKPRSEVLIDLIERGLFELEDNEKFLKEIEAIDFSETLADLEKFTADARAWPSDIGTIRRVAVAVGVSFDDAD